MFGTKKHLRGYCSGRVWLFVYSLQDAETNPLTDEELDNVIRKLYFKKVERVVKRNGKVKFEGKWYHLTKKMSGETVDIKLTLRGLEIWHNGFFIKRWEYWKHVLGIGANYILKKYLL